MSIVSNNIKYLRKINGLTQHQLAQKLGIKRSLIGAYEEARANPNLSNLNNIATTFGTTVDHLLKNDLRNSTLNDQIFEDKNVHQRPLTHEISNDNRSTGTTNQVELKSKKTDKPKDLNFEKNTKQITSFSTTQHEVDQIDIPTFNKPKPTNILVTSSSSQSSLPTIQWVSKKQLSEYLLDYQNPQFLSQLPTFQLPNLPTGYYRAFEIGEDFIFPGSILVGTFVRNWYDIKDGKKYIFVLAEGVIFRMAKSQDKTMGLLHLQSDISSIGDITVSLNEVLEVWEVKTFISAQLPTPTPSGEEIAKLVDQLQQEVRKLI